MKTAKGHTHRGKQGGFTLIEVMIASGLIGLEFLFVLSMFTASAKSVSYSRNLTTATSLAQTQVESAKNTPYVKLSLLAGAQCFDRQLGEVPCDANWAYQRVTTVTADRILPDTAVVEGISTIEVQCFWRDDSSQITGKNRSTRLVTAISKF